MLKESMNKLLNLEEYFAPPRHIIDAVSALELLFQIQRQDVMKAYHKHGKKNSFKGIMSEYIYARAMEDFYKDKDKPWSLLKRALFLIENKSDQVPAAVFLPGKEMEEIRNIIQKGLEAKPIVEKWLEPLQKSDNGIEAINDALELDVENRFQILELAVLEDHKTNGVKLFPQILQISSPVELVMYLRHHKEVRDCLIVTIHYNNTREWKSFFYIFLVYNGKLYSIDNSDKRLNEDNSEGDRSPDNYLDRHYDKIWLPIHLILDKKGDPSKKELMFPNTSVFKVGSFEDYVDSEPGYIYWLMVFMRKVVEIISEMTVSKGLTCDDLPKMLSSGTIPQYKGDPDGYESSSGNYLMDVYGSKVKAIVPKATAFSMVVATPEHMEKLVAYKSREEQAKQIDKLVQNDFKHNYKRVYKQISDLVKSMPVRKFIDKAFKDLEYTYTYYAQFGVDRCITPGEGGIEGDSEVRKGKIFYSNYSFGSRSDGGTRIILNNEFDYNKRWRCLLSPNYSAVSFYLCFKDYHQFLEFYELQEKDVPKEMIQHLHQQSTLYTGNSILDDTDPLDSVNDPWFVNDGPNSTYFYGNSAPELKVCFAICSRCVKKICRKLGVDATKWLPDSKKKK